MEQEIISIVPAIRMLASEVNLKAAKFCDFNELSIDEIKNYKGIKTAIIKKETLDDFLELGSSHEIFGAHVVVIEGLGSVLIADSQSDIGNLFAIIKKEKAEKKTIGLTGRVKNRIFIITGGAQGFGAGIAEEIFAEGGNVVIADLNAEKGKELAQKLNKSKRANKAVFISANVSDPQSVENLVKETVAAFGGLDVMISNAGILRAGGLEEMTPETFKLMTDINYTGYFYCAQAASKVMKVQTRHKKDFFCDILQINSKSGLQGSKKNFTYAGGKFGGVGLTQSFALELMEFNIKVNSICPGNFFEGPLWSDPVNGLFVQYLNAGKVPGAKTVSDVKKHYEKQVPAGRGCQVKDVVRAILYAVEQEYETGQAIPVTGGQVMLH